jgi:hypothetical protein
MGKDLFLCVLGDLCGRTFLTRARPKKVNGEASSGIDSDPDSDPDADSDKTVRHQPPLRGHPSST